MIFLQGIAIFAKSWYNKNRAYDFGSFHRGRRKGYLMSYRIFARDPALLPFEKDIQLRMDNYARTKKSLLRGEKSLSDFANAHEYFGFHKTEKGWA